jgi:hypothetical protein
MTNRDEFDDTPERLRQAINAHEPIKFACMAPELVEARRKWFREGAHGHYPGCQCGAPHGQWT